MPNWCKYSITSFIVGFSPRATKLERSRVGSLSASRTSGTASVLGDTSDVGTVACPGKAETKPRVQSSKDAGVAVSTATPVGDAGDINRKVRPPAAITNAMAM